VTHRGPFQPQPVCDSVLIALQNWGLTLQSKSLPDLPVWLLLVCSHQPGQKHHRVTEAAQRGGFGCGSWLCRVFSVRLPAARGPARPPSCAAVRPAESPSLTACPWRLARQLSPGAGATQGHPPNGRHGAAARRSTGPRSPSSLCQMAVAQLRPATSSLWEPLAPSVKWRQKHRSKIRQKKRRPKSNNISFIPFFALQEEILHYVCTNQDILSSKIGKCCEKPLLQRSECIVNAENDDKPADLSPHVREFIEDEGVCERFAQEKDTHLAR